MTTAAPDLTLLALGSALALFALSFGLAFGAANMLKRSMGAVGAIIAGALASLVLGAPPQVVLAGLAVALGHGLLAAALIARIHEHYGSVEVDQVDAADEAAERPK